MLQVVHTDSAAGIFATQRASQDLDNGVEKLGTLVPMAPLSEVVLR
jgi:hypothetical protein